MKKTLLLIPSVAKMESKAEVEADRHPTMDYYALAQVLRERYGLTVDIIDYAAVQRDQSPGTRLAAKVGGPDAALAWLAFVRRREYDSIFSNGENVGVPLALLLGSMPVKTRHVTIGHRLSTGKKQLYFQVLKAQRRLDKIFVYARSQQEWAVDRLHIEPNKLALIPFHADARFYRPMSDVAVNANQICSAGLEWRDYPTLIEAVRSMPDLSVKLAAASPWSKHEDQTSGRELPPNVEARRYSYAELRDLYAASSFVVVPIRETDFQAGVTTILEAMAMGKAVIATRTTGQTDVIVDGENGLCVAPGDVAGWQEAIRRLRGDPVLRAKLGMNARRWIEENATLELWAHRIAAELSPEPVPPG
ncbi:MAG: glycosyltransferase family 4 protein [Janthinobacterium lividum]